MELADQFLSSLINLKIQCGNINNCILVKDYFTKCRTDIIIDNLVPQYCSKKMEEIVL